MHSSHGYDYELWDEHGHLTKKGHRFIDSEHPEFLALIGKGTDGGDAIICCVLCGKSAQWTMDQIECTTCLETYCDECVWTGGCRRCNGSTNWKNDSISKHPYSPCRNSQCCGSGENAERKMHYCWNGCYGAGYSNGRANHFDGCEVVGHVEYERLEFSPPGPKLFPGETRLAPLRERIAKRKA